jgi:putative transcriptional regulator
MTVLGFELKSATLRVDRIIAPMLNFDFQDGGEDMKQKTFKSDAFAAIHASATALHKVGGIDKAMMRDFDVASFSEAPRFSAADIQKLRLRHHVSQPVFARYLNTSESTIEKWESGAKRPSGMALKLLAIVEKHGLSVLA